jgi:Ala-tRNA(Pro) deacylase
MIATHELTRLLDRNGISYEVLPHRRTETAGEEAGALGIDPHEVAKTVVLSTCRGYLRAVVPATERLDLNKVRELLDLHETPHLASEQEIAAAYPSFELGAVPPVGGSAGDRVVVDRGLADRESMVIEAGTHDQSVRVRTNDLLVLALASIGRICHD